MPTINKVANRLINEKSPYLLQHANNPVNWYPWGDEAFNKARSEDKPIFLSIGYSTCHWCHVMEHESFEDEEVAQLMNDNFVAIKVDREERPDVDSVYMTVCQALTGHGGWPLTIIMTPDQKPFYAGTYFPKYSRYGMPGVMDILHSVSEQWEGNKSDILDSTENIVSQLGNYFNIGTNQNRLNPNILTNGFTQLWDNFDEKYGGFGSAPKFPTPHKLMFLLRYYDENGEKIALDMVEKTLESMYRGGLYDHVGFGFSRYSTDEKWLVPHFEKMLYDNALLVMTYLEAYEVTKKELYKTIAENVLDYVFRQMVGKEGGFYSAEDADSEGEEGKFYVFNPVEIKRTLGDEEGDIFNKYFDITEEGNFEGKNIPNLINNKNFQKYDSKINESRKKVLEYRNLRMNLHKDDKILTAWNGLMIAAMGKAYRITGEEKYIECADKAVNLIFNSLVDKDGRLLARYRDGESLYKGYLDDYAFLTWGLIELYEGSFKLEYLKKAIELNREMIRLFWDDDKAGFFIYGKDGEKLIARPKELYDGAMPSGNSVAAYNLIKLSRFTGQKELEELAEKQLDFITSNLYGGEINHSFYLMAASFALSKSKELVCVVENDNDLENLKVQLRKKPNFNLTVLVKTNKNEKELEEIVPFSKDYTTINNKSTYYLCENNTCQAPVNNFEDLFDK
ncbi:thioredoxin domain-containing protein [Inconstantimicrobium mannanitabidum]|uniref:Thioredoxin domain-containing protein n=1 Tax=Inconstantimicrobium mannanitabidum TaxID=1604901 RepID=A0ACB5REE2_9CLOT|nr:thioredoxin domain-containing protein [Clostridium sp. TW13]GKX67126.1 thioredoxin domain-containing protein [Clostridium sp. TW13]